VTHFERSRPQQRSPTFPSLLPFLTINIIVAIDIFIETGTTTHQKANKHLHSSKDSISSIEPTFLDSISRKPTFWTRSPAPDNIAKAKYEGHLENFRRLLWRTPEYSFHYIRDECHIPFEEFLRKHHQGDILHKVDYMALLHLTQKLYDQYKSHKHQMPTFNEACGIAMNLPELD
jgi:hypothetical protein